MQNGFVVSLKESAKPLKDILMPLKRRIGYIEGSIPVIPIIFYRIIGTYGAESFEQDHYDNDLFELEEQLKQNDIGYIRFDTSIPMPNNEELTSIAIHPAQPFIHSPENLKSHALKIFTDSHLFFTSRWRNNIQTSMEQVINLYIQAEPSLNASKVENFTLKMMVWLKRYYPVLLQKEGGTDVPKCIFYGDIKAHEVYFITLLALIGIDVLYIHTDHSKEGLFQQIDPNQKYSKCFLLPHTAPLRPFPETDKRIRKKTVAYEASQEIESFIYDEEVGIFKSRQFESGTTKPITLKTTHDEMKILWNEEAKIRPEFRVKNATVYVPNFFVKVSGTYENLDDYWEELYQLTDAEHTVFLKHVNFTPITYTRQELYSTVFLFNETGSLDKQALYQHPVYKFMYLKGETQDFIFHKINEVIQSDLILGDMNVDRKVKVLMTILTMDAPFLRLIEAFDFTGKVPKIVVYDRDKENFTESDIILLAFFNLIGADIVLYTPTNYNTIEQWIKRDYFDIHQLPSVQFDLNIPERKPKKKKGFFQKLLSR